MQSLRRTLFNLFAPASRPASVRQECASGREEQPQTSEPTRVRAEARRSHDLILVAEDNETNRKVIMLQLQLIGVAAEVVPNAHQALERWRSRDFVLLLTDLHMPEMDGFALAKAVRAEEGESRRIPIVALTANALPDQEARCRAAGMDGYLTKPVRLAQLKSMVGFWLGDESLLPVPVAREPAPAVADLSVLIELVGDDPTVIDKVLQAYRDSAAESVRAVNAGIAAGTLHEVANAAHKLKSAARSIGAQGLGEICADIEQAAEAGSTAELGALVRAFLSEVDAVYRFLDSA